MAADALTRLSVCPPSARQNLPRLGEEEAVVLSAHHLQQESALITPGIKITPNNPRMTKWVWFLVYLDNSTVETIDPVNEVAAAERNRKLCKHKHLII